MRYLMIVQYNGKNYCGFQIQKNGNSIQNELEKAIEIVTKEKTKCVASGRTDAKVSAYNQPVHFECEKPIDEKKFIRSINGVLPSDIQVKLVFPTTLHARFSAKQKTYQYKMYVSNISLPLYADALQISENLNFKEMKKFCKLVVGTHDFVGFRAVGGENETTIRTIYSCKLKKENGCLNFYVTGNGFLYKMVRNLVGTMLEVGKGKLDLSTLKPTLFSTFKATATAKPEFLYLYDVQYK